MKIRIIIGLCFALILSCGKKKSEETAGSGQLSPDAEIIAPGEELESGSIKSEDVDTDPLATVTEQAPTSESAPPLESLDQTVIQGCMDPLAFNYDPDATEDDGACVAVVLGCMDNTMFNYNPTANISDGSCIAISLGCIDNQAFNYDADANTDDGSCIAKVLGCTDSSYLEYDSNANTDDGSCTVAIVQGCTDAGANNYDPLANTDEGSCNAVAIDPEQSLPVADIAGTGSSLSVGAGSPESNAGQEGVLGGEPTFGFDGDDMLAISNSNTFNLGGPFYGKTMTMVFRSGSDISSTQMIFEEGGAIRGVNLYISGGKLHYNIYNIVVDGGNPAWGPVSVSVDIEADTDYVATLYYDETAGVLRGYLNGTLVGEAFGCGILYAHSDAIGMGAVNNDAVLGDGTVITTGGHYFTGLIANFIYYNEAVSGTQLDAIHEDQMNRYLP